MKKLKLKPLKLTKASSSGVTSTKTIKRGIPGETPGRYLLDQEKEWCDHLEDDQEGGWCDHLEDDHDQGVEDLGLQSYRNLPSMHEIKEIANVSFWASIRPSLMGVVTESHAMPDLQMCVVCLHSQAAVRCTDCGPCVYYCYTCLEIFHLRQNVFHVPEAWKVYAILDHVPDSNH